MRLFRVAAERVRRIGAAGRAVVAGLLPQLRTPREPFSPEALIRWVRRSPWGQALVVLFAFGAVGVVLLVGYLMFAGPRMRTQPRILPFQAAMPLAPADAVPLVDPVPYLPSIEAAMKLRNPLKPTPENLARGKVYYRYYCLFCHGEHGDGHGPVGESYVPVPANLRTAKIKAYPDGKLLHAMLAGPGHEPILPRVVPPEHRWPLVLYIRHWP